MKELCSDERPREKLVGKGAGSLSNAELLAIMLRTESGFLLFFKLYEADFSLFYTFFFFLW